MLWRPMVSAVASTIGYCATTCSRRWWLPRSRIESLRHAADRHANVPSPPRGVMATRVSVWRQNSLGLSS
ncbi:MAG: hypothetical protein HDT00_02565 [Bacteroidales bacterium]|nr:hypothetical protein [Bacteroidales bacterium]